MKSLPFSALLLNSIMAAFKPMYIANRSLQLLDMIIRCSEESFPSYLLLRTLGLCVSLCPPPIEHRRQVLSVVWKQMSSLNNPDNYINCVEAWIEYAVQYCTVRIDRIRAAVYSYPSYCRVKKLM